MYLKFTILIALAHFCVNEDPPKFFLGSIEKNIINVMNNNNWSGMAYDLIFTTMSYNRYLTDILVQCKNNNIGELMVTKSLCEAGGPRMLRHNFNHTFLKQDCGWSEIEILDFRNILSDTAVVWQTFKRIVSALQWHKKWSIKQLHFQRITTSTFEKRLISQYSKLNSQ